MYFSPSRFSASLIQNIGEFGAKKYFIDHQIAIKMGINYWATTVYTVKFLVSEQIAFAAVLYFGQVFVFCKLISKSVLEWFLLMCK